MQLAVQFKDIAATCLLLSRSFSFSLAVGFVHNFCLIADLDSACKHLLSLVWPHAQFVAMLFKMPKNRSACHVCGKRGCLRMAPQEFY